jgi:hypothetical protein
MAAPTALEDLGPTLLAEVLRRAARPGDVAAARLASRALDAAARGALKRLTISAERAPPAPPDWARFPRLEALRLVGWDTLRAGEAGGDAGARAAAGGGGEQAGEEATMDEDEGDEEEALALRHYFESVARHQRLLRACFSAPAGSPAAAALGRVARLDLLSSSLDSCGLAALLCALPGLRSLRLCAVGAADFNPGPGTLESDEDLDEEVEEWAVAAAGAAGFVAGCASARATLTHGSLGPRLSRRHVEAAAATARLAQVAAVASAAPALERLEARGLRAGAEEAALLGRLTRLIDLELDDLDFSDGKELEHAAFSHAAESVQELLAGATGAAHNAESAAAAAAFKALPRARLERLAIGRLPNRALGALGLDNLTELAGVALAAADVPALAAGLPRLRRLSARPVGPWHADDPGLAGVSLPGVTHTVFFGFTSAPAPAPTFSRGARLAALLPGLEQLALESEAAPAPDLWGLTALTALIVGPHVPALPPRAWSAIGAMPRLARLRATIPPQRIGALTELAAAGALAAVTCLDLRAEAARAPLAGGGSDDDADREAAWAAIARGTFGGYASAAAAAAAGAADDAARAAAAGPGGVPEWEPSQAALAGTDAAEPDLWDVISAAAALPALRALGVAAPQCVRRRGGHWGGRAPVTERLAPLGRAALRALVLRAPALNAEEATFLPRLLGGGGARLDCVVVSHTHGDAAAWARVAAEMGARGTALAVGEELADRVMHTGSWAAARAAGAGFGGWAAE